jgi:hypothetical protein
MGPGLYCPHDGAIAQLGERHAGSVEVAGSSPASSIRVDAPGWGPAAEVSLPRAEDGRAARRQLEGVRRCDAILPVRLESRSAQRSLTDSSSIELPLSAQLYGVTTRRAAPGLGASWPGPS